MQKRVEKPKTHLLAPFPALLLFVLTALFSGNCGGGETANSNDFRDAGVTITQSGGKTGTVEGGPPDSYSVVLDTEPAASVDIIADPDAQSDLGAGAGNPITLTFTDLTWMIPQTVSVVAVDDGLVEGAHTSTITHRVSSSDSRYDGIVIDNIVADIADANTSPVAVIRIDRTGGPVPLVIHADASASSDRESLTLRAEWDFGDSSSSEGEFVAHSYTSPGTYVVTLTVTDAGGGSAKDSMSVLAGPPALPEPPPQLGWGPGGSEYPYGGVIENSYGSGASRYWIFEPKSPTPETDLPMIGFIHGFSVVEPSIYREWIYHIVRRGNIVIFPQYQEGVLTPPSAFTGNAAVAITSALTELMLGIGHASPDRTKFALVGHSWGGVIAANIAALASSDSDLPPVSALQCTEPGTGGLGGYEEYSKIPAGTLLLSIAGEDDTLVGETDAMRIYLEATAIPEEDKDYILVLSDDYGSPPILADHSAPTDIGIGSGSIRWFGFWKWFDALRDAAFFGKNREYALGNNLPQRFMGYWSDGTPVKEPVVTDTP